MKRAPAAKPREVPPKTSARKFSDYRDRIESLVKAGKLSVSDIARAVGAPMSTVADWIKAHWPAYRRRNGRPPGKAQDRFAPVTEVIPPGGEEQAPPEGPVPETGAIIDTLKRRIADALAGRGFGLNSLPFLAPTLRVMIDAKKAEDADKPPENLRRFTVYLPQVVEVYRDDVPALPAPADPQDLEEDREE